MDILRDEGLLYADTLTEAGVPTDVHLFPGLPHAFATIPDVKEARQRWNEIVDGAVAWALSKPASKENIGIQSE
ncbi:Type I Iterative PKS [Pestalotiopsis sp. IQ-011]